VVPVVGMAVSMVRMMPMVVAMAALPFLYDVSEILLGCCFLHIKCDASVLQLPHGAA